MDLDALDTAYGAEKLTPICWRRTSEAGLNMPFGTRPIADETRSVRNATALMLGICVMSSVRSTTS